MRTSFTIPAGLLCLFSFPVFAAEKEAPASTQASSEKPLYEIGVTLGTPAIANLVLGYWSANSFPWLVRVSGMDYGSEYAGIQADFGWAFTRNSTFKQFVALSFATFHIDDTDSSDTLHFTGVGPTYGFNWHGLTVNSTIAFGSTSRPYEDDAANNSSVQFLAQIGYTFLF